MMLDWLLPIFALALPWLAATLWLRVLFQQPSPGRWPAILGYGYLLGLTAVTLCLRLLALAGQPLSIWLPLVVSGLASLGALVYLRRNGTATFRTDCAPAPTADPVQSNWQRLLLAILLLWLGLRVLTLALEVWWQPLFPWDAWTTWGARARVWTELEQLIPFVSPQEWLQNPADGAYTIDAWNYPITVSVLSMWPALASGSWNETAANLPWLGCFLALILGFFGQARLWGAPLATSLVFLWILISLPVLDTQVALAGYADLWLGCALGLAFMAFLQWSRSGDRRQAVLAVLMLLISVSLKREGIVWVGLFIPALVAARLPRRWLLSVPALLIAVAALLWTTGGIDLQIPGLGTVALTARRIELPLVGAFDLALRGTWQPMLMHLFVYGNWHLLAYAVPIALGAAVVLIARGNAGPSQRAGLTWSITTMLGIYVLFFWTFAYQWVESGTSINRVLLHFTSALVFWIMTVWMDWLATAAASTSAVANQPAPDRDRPSLTQGDAF